jgi:hypothetical protein
VVLGFTVLSTKATPDFKRGLLQFGSFVLSPDATSDAEVDKLSEKK